MTDLVITRRLLRYFCDDDRPGIEQPWSAGAWSYATNGSIAVRVDRLPDVEERLENPHHRLNEWIAAVGTPERVALPTISLPQPKRTPCEVCDGRGSEHDCPDCTCPCEECGTDGYFEETIAVRWRDHFINAENWKLMAGLDARVSMTLDAGGRLSFTFDGGVGLVMPMMDPKSKEGFVVVEAPQ